MVANPRPNPARVSGPARLAGPPAWKRREVARLDDWRRDRDARQRREAREAAWAEWARANPPHILGIRWKRDPLAYRWLQERLTPYHMDVAVRMDMVAAQEELECVVGYEMPNPEWAWSYQYAKFRTWEWSRWDEELPEGVIPHFAVVPASIAIGCRSRKYADSIHLWVPLSDEGVRLQMREDER